MNSRVSVIIPTYNYAHFLDECLSSVLKQSYKNLEIIVVDDGSIDDTKKVISKYGNKINYIYQENSGPSAARNTGINCATGELIQFLDSDDQLHNNSIEERVKIINTSGASCVVCRNKLFTNTSSSGEPRVEGSWKIFSENLDVHLCYFNIAPPHSFLTKRSVVTEVGLFDINLKACEDYDYWLRLLEKKHIPLYCDTGLVYYRKHSESLSSNSNNQWYYDAVLHIRLYDKLFESNNLFINNKFASSLAFLCGILITLNRLYGKDVNIYNELYKLVEPTFNKISDISYSDENYKDFETIYYLVKLSNIINKIYKKNDFIYGNYKKLLRNNGLISNIGIVNHVLLKSLFSKEIKNKNKFRIMCEYLNKFRF